MTADELAKLPTYYVMDRDADMAATVAPFMPSREQVASCQWMTESDLDFCHRIRPHGFSRRA
jgi:hypothetical protein